MKPNRLRLKLSLILCLAIGAIACVGLTSHDFPIADTSVFYPGTAVQYKVALVHARPRLSLHRKGAPYAGHFALVVRDSEGLLVNRASLNQLLHEPQLKFDAPVNLVDQDCDGNNLPDISIGFPAEDGSGEFRYAIASIDLDAAISIVPASGYKSDGFIYTVAGAPSVRLNAVGCPSRGTPREILVGVQQPGGSFEPAKYVWDGQAFRFKRDSLRLVSQAKMPDRCGGYSVSVVQTEYKRPLQPEDPGFSIYESAYRGRFDLLVHDQSQKLLSRTSLNQYFGNDDLGFIGDIVTVFTDWNGDGDCDFAVGRPCKDSPESQYVILSVDSSGGIYRLPAGGYKQDGYVYSAGTPCHRLVTNPQIGILVTLGVEHGYIEARYLWDGSSFVFAPGAE